MVLGIYVWEMMWFVCLMMGVVVLDMMCGVDGCFMGGDIDMFMCDVMIVVFV